MGSTAVSPAAPAPGSWTWWRFSTVRFTGRNPEASKWPHRFRSLLGTGQAQIVPGGQQMGAHVASGLLFIPGGDGVYNPAVLGHGLVGPIMGAQGGLPAMEVVTGNGVHEDCDGSVFSGVGHQAMELDIGPYQAHQVFPGQIFLEALKVFLQ